LAEGQANGRRLGDIIEDNNKIGAICIQLMRSSNEYKEEEF